MTANTHHTKLKGDIAVAAVILDLTKKGYIISEPMSENAPYDLICDTGSDLLRIQVKYRSDGIIPHYNSWTDKNGIHKNTIDTTKFDYFAMVNEDYSKICYPLSIMAGKSIAFNIPNSTTPFNWYKNYLDFKDKIQPKDKNNNVDYSVQTNNLETQPTKIEWPSVEQMQILVYEKPTSQLALELGVSDVAIGKFCKRNNITKPERGYWAKLQYSTD